MKTLSLSSALIQFCFILLGLFLLSVFSHQIQAQGCNTYYGNATVSACDLYTWNGTTYTTSGVYTYTSLNSQGCVNTSTLDLTVNYTSTIVTNMTACAPPFIWPANNVAYYNSGLYEYTSQNASGCLYTQFLNLTVLHGIHLSAKVMLSGAYDPLTGLMKDSLRQLTLCYDAINGASVCPPLNVIPLTRQSNFFQIPCPLVNDSMIGGGDPAIAAAILAESGPNAIVDWVMVELRDGNNANNILVTQWALLQRDGDLVSALDGVSSLSFPCQCPDNYYISIKHRNHLGIMSANPVSMGMSSTIIDFTSTDPNLVWVKPGYLLSFFNAPRMLSGERALLWGGDANTNKVAKYNGLWNDKEIILSDLGLPNINNTLYQVYRRSDLNMDGRIRYNGFENDKTWLLNMVMNAYAGATSNTVLAQHTPN